jgi:hypothetical protein
MRLQASGQIAVQFDNGQLVQAFADRFGQRGRPGRFRPSPGLSAD